MSDADAAPAEELVLDYEFDEPPEKVWRAVSDGDLRRKWLPEDFLADPIATVPGREVRYRMRDDEPPYLNSIVTFELSPGTNGGTRLRVIHRPAAASADRPPQAANGNRTVMRAA